MTPCDGPCKIFNVPGRDHRERQDLVRRRVGREESPGEQRTVHLPADHLAQSEDDALQLGTIRRSIQDGKSHRAILVFRPSKEKTAPSEDEAESHQPDSNR